jgi:hypothetical protein
MGYNISFGVCILLAATAIGLPILAAIGIFSATTTKVLGGSERPCGGAIARSKCTH